MQNNNNNMQSAANRKRNWTQEENKALLQGIERHHHRWNKFRRIHKDPQFGPILAGRTKASLPKRLIALNEYDIKEIRGNIREIFFDFTAHLTSIGIPLNIRKLIRFWIQHAIKQEIKAIEGRK
jgi:hypothetical protein